MIALGITPGVRSLAYCVLYRRAAAIEPMVVDSDLLKGGKPMPNDGRGELMKKVKPHALTLHVVLERAFDVDKTVVMAIGPGSDKEPAELLYLVRAMLTGLAVELGERNCPIVCLNWQTDQEMADVLGTPVKRAVRRSLGRVAPALVRTPYVMAAGAALAAFEHLRRAPT